MTASVAGTFGCCGDSPNGHLRFVTRRLSSGDAGGVLHSKIGSILQPVLQKFFHKSNVPAKITSRWRLREGIMEGGWRKHGTTKSQSPHVLRHPKEALFARKYLTTLHL